MDIQEKTTACSQKNPRNFYKIILICTAGIFALLVVAFLSATYILTEYRYARANTLIEKGKYTEAYYLLKEAGGVVKLFYYDESGNESLIADTDIAFLLISEKDQEAFRNGIVIKDREELNELLQDFES